VLAVRGVEHFLAAFALLGGQGLVEHWVLSMNLTPVQFMLLSQAIISSWAGRWNGRRSSSSSCRSSSRCWRTSTSTRCSSA